MTVQIYVNQMALSLNIELFIINTYIYTVVLMIHCLVYSLVEGTVLLFWCYDFFCWVGFCWYLLWLYWYSIIGTMQLW